MIFSIQKYFFCNFAFLIESYVMWFSLQLERVAWVSSLTFRSENQNKGRKKWKNFFIGLSAKSKIMSDGDTLSIVIKWAAKEYPIDNVPLTNTVQDLKNAIHVKTNVLPARQKLLNLRFKGKAPSDDQCLSSLSKFWLIKVRGAKPQ